MDSYSYYLLLCQKYMANAMEADKNDVDGLVRLIYNECFSPEGNSSFLKAVCETFQANNSNGISTDASINMVDARVLLEAVCLTAAHQNYSISTDPNIEKYMKTIFRGRCFTKEVDLRISEIRNYVGQLTKLLPKEGQQDASCLLPTSEVATQRLQVEANTVEQGVPASNGGTLLSTIQEDTSSAEKENSKLQKERLALRQQTVEQWHKDCLQLNDVVLTLQSDMSGLLSRFIGFSDSLTENYVLRFANNLIELYDLIYDGFNYHNPRGRTSGDLNYCNSVANYQVYMDVITDALADFGVEEIKSIPADSFDGRIHEVRNTSNFTPRISTIKTTVRSGFRYGDIVLQKEWVEV